MESNTEIYERVLEAFNREGMDGVLPYFSDEVEVFDPDLPPGDYRGREGVRIVTDHLSSGMKDMEVKDFRFFPAGDRVVALIHTQAKGEDDEIEFELRDAHTLTFRDGKIVYWRLYLDQAEALSDAGLDPGLALGGSGED